MFRYRVKYVNFKQPGYDFGATITLDEHYNKEVELVQALQQVIAKEEELPMQDIIVLKISPER
ncbi:hypothetical protein H7992_21615 [Sporosarcina sp. resist]|uniref:hypothetical protein n=1 Tax=Sporosarcina sp. resist TaxID=2762563 RepID=UPI00164D420D|nr:hypothetical protein [Sporosarcina sp. resist]QNK87734.1 hypothetical protein H7992_21615 [Sporosarcina sp. resist]